MAGCYPGSTKEENAHKRIEGLLDHGIRHVINLMETFETNHSVSPFSPYEPIMESIADTKGLALSFERMPIRDLNIPTKEEMKNILDAIDMNIDNHKPVYVHCWGGRGRTGTVVGCYSWTLTKTDPPVLKKIYPGSAQLFVSFEDDNKIWFSMHRQRRFSGMQ
jgi:protein tyrosine phosphatase